MSQDPQLSAGGHTVSDQPAADLTLNEARAEVERLRAEMAAADAAARDSVERRLPQLRDLAAQREIECERDALRAEVTAVQRVVDAARRWAEIEATRNPQVERSSIWLEAARTRRDALVAAVDALPTREETRPTPHRYLSWACWHADDDPQPDLHGYCQTNATRYDGTEKVAAECKFCPAKCVCHCHEGTTDG